MSLQRYFNKDDDDCVVIGPSGMSLPCDYHGISSCQQSPFFVRVPFQDDYFLRHYDDYGGIAGVTPWGEHFEHRGVVDTAAWFRDTRKGLAKMTGVHHLFGAKRVDLKKIIPEFEAHDKLRKELNMYKHDHEFAPTVEEMDASRQKFKAEKAAAEQEARRARLIGEMWSFERPRNRLHDPPSTVENMKEAEIAKNENALKEMLRERMFPSKELYDTSFFNMSFPSIADANSFFKKHGFELVPIVLSHNDPRLTMEYKYLKGFNQFSVLNYCELKQKETHIAFYCYAEDPLNRGHVELNKVDDKTTAQNLVDGYKRNRLSAKRIDIRKNEGYVNLSQLVRKNMYDHYEVKILPTNSGKKEFPNVEIINHNPAHPQRFIYSHPPSDISGGYFYDEELTKKH